MQVRNDFTATPASVVARTLSTSFVAALDDDRRAAVLEAVAELIATDPDTAGRESFTFPNLTNVHWCHRLD